MQISTTEKALYLKIVYYGPALSGKTTNLETIHRLTDPRRRQPMVSLKTEGDRTLFFDLLPYDLGQLHGFNVRVKLYTVPGQIQYDTTRKQVLAGADGVVFVADSNPAQRDANRLMLRYLRNNLHANGLDYATIPMVLQWNKRDLVDAMSPEQMEAELNDRRVKTVAGVATVGTGIMETFYEIAAATLEHQARKSPSVADRIQVDEVRGRLAGLFGGLVEAGRKAAASPPAQPIGRTIPGPGARASDETPDEDLKQHFGLDELLSEAVQTNLTFSERLVADASREQLILRIRRERKALFGLSHLAGGSQDADGLSRLMLRATLGGLELGTGSVLELVRAGAPLREVAVAGRKADPLNSIVSHGIGSVATALLSRQQILLTADPIGELLFGQPHPALDGLRGLLAVPWGGHRLLLLYADSGSRDLDPDDAEFANLVTSICNLALRSAPVRQA